MRETSSPPVGDDLTTATISSARPDERVQSTPPAEPVRAADGALTAAAAPITGEQTVAILLARSEINSVADLNNKTVAIDLSPRYASVASIKAAFAAAGAAEVQLDESERLALTRVIDGEVSAAVVNVGSPADVAKWSGLPNINVLQVPLSGDEKQGK